jgi:glucose/mannose-6-phosphate isomerase
MQEAVRRTHEQFSYVPEIVHADGLHGPYKQYILGGMGGSHLAAGLLKLWKQGVNVYVHRSYDLPPYDEEFLESSLHIACSYSGNTEETISFAEAALDRHLPLLIITTGGALLAFAQKQHVPHIILPSTGVQPRAALGYMLIALATAVHEPVCVGDMHVLGETFRAETYQARGEEIATAIGNATPVIYASVKNVALAYTWKIKLNETGKIPAFYNVLPEANHNEMQGFGAGDGTYHFIMLTDEHDHSGIQRRMRVLSEMLEEVGYSVTQVPLEGESTLARAFASLAIADWVSLRLAETKKRDPEAVPMVEAFKKALSRAK